MRALLIMLLLSPFCLAQTVKVRVLNGNNGHPLPNQRVSVQFFYDNPAEVTPPLRLATNSSGEAQFNLPSPAPQHMDVRISLTSDHWKCSCWVMNATDVVLHKGILTTLPKQKVSPPAFAEPATITFLPVPMSFIEKLLYPLVKE